jgi:predicted O-methyltransferase YrrM
MVRRARPARIVEVGSGHSTRFLARAVADGGLATRMTSIDPEPRAALAGLQIERIARRVQEAEPRVFAGADLLFIDSSHKLEPGSDVEFLLERALPVLAPGALVHFHDIFLPAGYPAHWAWRNYSEQPAVAALIASGRYAPEFASAWVIAHRPEWLAQGVLARLPLVPGAIESSLWLRRLG